jgi:antitoxin MazE
MLTKLQKWGNSLGLRIPRAFAADAKLEPGSVVDVSLVRGALMVRLAPRRKYRLHDLLKGVTDRNLHGEMGSGRPVGRESWWVALPGSSRSHAGNAGSRAGLDRARGRK